MSKTKYVAGDELTVADISITTSLKLTDLIDFDLSDYKNITAWLEKVKKELPNYDEFNPPWPAELKQTIKSKLNSQ